MSDFEDEAYDSDLADDWEQALEDEERVPEPVEKKEKKRKEEDEEEDAEAAANHLTEEAERAAGEMQQKAAEGATMQEMLDDTAAARLGDVDPKTPEEFEQFGRDVAAHIKERTDAANAKFMLKPLLQSLVAGVKADDIDELISKVKLAANAARSTGGVSKKAGQRTMGPRQLEGIDLGITDRGGAACVAAGDDDFM